MKIDLKEYILEKRQVLLAVALGLLIYSLVLLLYQIPPEAAGYGILLVFIAEFVWLLSGFGRFRKKQKLLRQLAGERAKDFYLRDLPESEDPKEEAYQDLIESLLKEKNRKEAEAAEKLRDMEEYYTLWVHQIKTPIAGLQLLLQMERSELEEAESKDEITEELYVKQLQNLTDVEEELFRIEEYVGMALQYQRINSTANDYILKQISLDTVIREVIHKYAKIMIRRKIRMHYEKTEATVISDEKWLSFVLEQLLSNAVKYTPEGEISIEVQEEPQHIWLEIRDTGIGIRSEDIPRVFEKGYTGFNGHEDKRSTGIGLYLCREVLQKLGHTIQVQSEVGEGTTVRAGFSKDAIDFRD